MILFLKRIKGNIRIVTRQTQVLKFRRRGPFFRLAPLRIDAPLLLLQCLAWRWRAQLVTDDLLDMNFVKRNEEVRTLFQVFYRNGFYVYCKTWSLWNQISIISWRKFIFFSVNRWRCLKTFLLCNNLASTEADYDGLRGSSGINKGQTITTAEAVFEAAFNASRSRSDICSTIYKFTKYAPEWSTKIAS